jgi:hypothetical protein
MPDSGVLELDFVQLTLLEDTVDVCPYGQF